MGFTKSSLTICVAVVAISLTGAAASQAATAQACDVSLQTASGASNQVIRGDVTGVGNGRGVTVTRRCRPEAAPKASRKPANKSIVSRECRHVRPAYAARCEWHLKRVREARRLISRDLLPR